MIQNGLKVFLRKDFVGYLEIGVNTKDFDFNVPHNVIDVYKGDHPRYEGWLNVKVMLCNGGYTTYWFSPESFFLYREDNECDGDVTEEEILSYINFFITED